MQRRNQETEAHDAIPTPAKSAERFLRKSIKMTQAPFLSGVHLVKVPNLYSPDVVITLVNWTTPVGSAVIPGERIAELLVDAVLFHLESDCEGTLKKYLVSSGAIVSEGQAIAEIHYYE